MADFKSPILPVLEGTRRGGARSTSLACEWPTDAPMEYRYWWETERFYMSARKLAVPHSTQGEDVTSDVEMITRCVFASVV